MAYNLVYNRTQSDVDYVKTLRDLIRAGTATPAQITEYLSAPIGAYCAADVNRVNTAVNAIAALLTAAGYPYSPNMATNWTDSDEFLAADQTAYLAGVDGLRSVLAVWSSTPTTPTDISSYAEVNDIEKICEDVYQLYLNMVDGYYRLDEIYMGEVN